MGITRSPEIAESIEGEQKQIERSLDFLRKLLQKDEKIHLNITITADKVTLTDQLKILVGKRLIMQEEE